MAIVALTKGDTFPYVSDRDPAKKKVLMLVDESDPSKGEILTPQIGEGATTFQLRPLDVFLMGHIYDAASLLTGKQGDTQFDIKTRINQTNIDAVRYGLAGFDNFKDARGVGVKYATVKSVVNGREYDAVTDEIIDKLDLTTIGELAQQIKEASEVKAEDEKKYV